MFERYTEKARRVIFFGRYEASQMGSSYIEAEHLLLGILREDKLLANRFLGSHANVESLRKQVEDRFAGREKISTSVDMPLSLECKLVLKHAAEEAENALGKMLDTTQLFLGVLREEPSFAAKLLGERGVTLASVREELNMPATPPQFPPGTPILSCEKLKKSYPTAAGELVVFAELDLTVNSGELVAIVGESGCGKSTLLHLLGGLDRPTGGTIHFRGQDISALGEKAAAEFRNRHIGFVWQIHYLLPEFTAVENAMMPLLIRGVRRDEATIQAMELLRDVGLSSRARHRAGELSGGEQQRVVLARALVGEPSLLLADEPTGNLDARTGAQVFDLIRDLHRKRGLTSVMVTHNLAFAEQCDRAFRLENGILRSGL